MVGETDEIHACGSAGGFPAPGFFIAVIPSAAISNLIVATELTNIINQGTGIANGKSAVAVDSCKGIARAALIGTSAVIEAEDVGEVVFGMLDSNAAVGLVGLENDRIPSILHPAGLPAVAVPLRPIGRLVVVPEAGDVNISGVARSVLRCEGAEQDACESECEDVAVHD